MNREQRKLSLEQGRANGDCKGVHDERITVALGSDGVLQQCKACGKYLALKTGFVPLGMPPQDAEEEISKEEAEKRCKTTWED